MPDQSYLSKTEELKLKVVNGKITNNDFEALKIEARSSLVCQDLFQTTGLLEKLIFNIFEGDLKPEGIKLLINIATNEPKSRGNIASSCVDKFDEFLRMRISKDIQFLIFRLIFLVTIDFEGAEVFVKSEQLEMFISEIFSKLPDMISDNSDDGKICVDILRFRYNLLRHDLMNHEKAVYEAIGTILKKLEIERKSVNLIGSCLNVCLGHGLESIVIIGLENAEIKRIITMMTKLYLENENKDHLATTLMVVMKFVDIEENRMDLRREFLPIGNSKANEIWKRLLVVIDISITFLTGEFLLKLCKGNVSRFIRHVGFESSAGYLHTKGLLKGGAVNVNSRIDLEGDSSDEEYFALNPLEPTNQSPLEAENEEEAAELEYLMKRISQYNERC